LIQALVLYNSTKNVTSYSIGDRVNLDNKPYILRRKDMSRDNPLSKDSRVIVRIWTFCNRAIIPGDNVGHIALETQLLGKHEYLSF